MTKNLFKKNYKNMALVMPVFLGSFIFPGVAYAYKINSFEIEIRGAVSGAYDDNITYVKQDRKTDFTVTPLAGVGIKQDGKTHDFLFNGNIKRELFAENNRYNNTAEDFNVSYSNDLSKKDTLIVTDTFVHAEEPRSFEDAFGRISGRYSYYTNKLNLRYSREISKQFRVLGRYENDIDLFSRVDLHDSYLNSAGVEADYIINSDVTVLVSYDYLRRLFDPGGGAYANTVSAGFSYNLTKRIFFSCLTGLDLINSYDKKDHTKPFVFTKIEGEIDDTTRADLSFKYKTYSFPYFEDYFDYWQFSGTFTKEVLERLTLSAMFFFGNGKYIDYGLKYGIAGVGGALTYDINDKIKASLSYSYSGVDSNLEFQEYDKNVVALTVTVVF
ncbi:MAG: outer membrane beta-barrel protein [Candidatus Omnitrophota bacterium]